MTLDTLRVFTHSDCPHSQSLLEDFNRRGVAFVQIDIAVDPEGLRLLREVCWEHRLPVVVDHERISIGFRGRSSTFDEVGLRDAL